MSEATWSWAALLALCLSISVLGPSPRWLRRSGDLPRRLTWRNRTATTAVVLAFLFAARGLWPDPIDRAQVQYVFVITLGYGHLIGGAVFSLRRLERLARANAPGALISAFLLVTLATLFAGYGLLLNAWRSLLFPLFAVSIWHIVENDLALERAYRHRLQLGPLPRDLGHHALAIGLTALVSALAQATLAHPELAAALHGTVLGEARNGPMRALAGAAGAVLIFRHALRGRGALGAGLIAVACVLPGDLSRTSWPAFGDVFSAATLYHLVQWLVFFGDRSRKGVPGSEANPTAIVWRRIAWVHAPPAALCALVLAVPSNGPGTIAYALFSPAIYLFWSVLHVVQTAIARGIEVRRRADTGAGRVWV